MIKSKLGLLCLIGLTTLVLFAATMVAADDYVATGDVDCSGAIDEIDLALVLNFYEGDHIVPPCPWQMDLNGDCLVDVDDFYLLSECLSNPDQDCPTVTTCGDPVVRWTCCEGVMRGDANSSDEDATEVPTIGDISVMIDALFITGDCVGPDPGDPIIACLDEADVNQSAESFPTTCDDITIGDVSTLVDYLFVEGPSPYFIGCPDCCKWGYGSINDMGTTCIVSPCPD